MLNRFTVLARSSTGLFDIPLGHTDSLEHAAYIANNLRATSGNLWTEQIIRERSRSYPFRTIRQWAIERRDNELALVEQNP